MKLYDRVKNILETDYKTRSDDKLLMWKVWSQMGKIDSTNRLTYFSFFTCISPESITRARRKVQELCPELRATSQVEALRAERESMKGNFVFTQEAML